MSKAKLNDAALKLLAKVASSVIGNNKVEMFITTPYICDHCEDDDKEAFPYHVRDKDGRFWADLCNGCFDELGCKYEEEE